MAQHSPRITVKEKQRILKLHKDGLKFSVIAKRVGRPARTCSRVVQASLDQTQKQLA